MIRGACTPGGFLSFMAAVGMLYNPLRKLSKMHGVLQKSLAAADRIWEIVDQKTESAESAKQIGFNGLTDSIVYKNVYFNLKKGKPLLKQVNLNIQAGTKAALLGFSTSDRMALVDLIPRFYEVSSGQILIDGADISQYSIKSLRAGIGILSRKVILFNDTVKNNITLRENNINKQHIKAAEKACLHDFIKTLPAGYETVLNTNSSLFSRKQKKLLNIARIFCKNPDILIIDDSDTSLDMGSDKLLEQAITALMKDRTSLIITSRLSIAKACDKIVVMDKGIIIEQGAHSELSQAGGYYHKLSEYEFFNRRELS